MQFPNEYNVSSSTPYCTTDSVWADGEPTCNIDINTVTMDG